MTKKNLDLNKFDLSRMVPEPCILAIAKRNTGKTVICRDIAYTLRSIPVAMIMCQTDNVNGAYNKIFGGAFVYAEYSEDAIKKIFQRQNAMIEQNNERKKLGKKPIDHRLLLIMDDILSDAKKFSKDKTFQEIIFNGRHFGITIVLSIQDPIGIPPKIRDNFDYVFLLKARNNIAKEKLFKYYLGDDFDNIREFKSAFDECTSDYKCMVVDNKTESNEVSDRIHWFKADIHDDFKFGCKQFQKYNEEHYNPEWNKKMYVIKKGKKEINTSGIRLKDGEGRKKYG